MSNHVTNDTTGFVDENAFNIMWMSYPISDQEVKDRSVNL